MSNEITKFTTYGPNRGLTLQIGNFQFVDGVCEVAANEANAAASILTRYHDVCYGHELEQKTAEYDTAQANRAAASGTFPEPKKPANSPKAESKQVEPEHGGEQQPSDDAAKTEAEGEAKAPQGEGQPEAEGKKAGGKKKQS